MRRESRQACFVAFCIALLLLLAAGASAQSPSRQRPGTTPRAAEPVEESGPRIPVNVEHIGSDPVGARLAFSLKEVFGKSPLFRAASGDEKKITVRVTTKAEFADRPGLASGWSAIWLFSEQSDVLGFYLESELGFTGRDEAPDVAVSLASRTEEVAKRFSYLFE